MNTSTLFDEQTPVLVEVRFPGMATFPDWYFCREKEELESILSRLGGGNPPTQRVGSDRPDRRGGGREMKQYGVRCDFFRATLARDE
jgi:hypothetical protein